VLTLVRSKFPSAPTPSAVIRQLRNPLLSNGYLLTLSSGLTAIFGFGYWAVAAWKYDAATVGSNSAAISMMTMVATIAQLNLSSAVVRFVPTAKRRTKQLVAGAYLLSGCVALLVGVCSVTLVRLISPGTNFFAEPLSRAMFVFGTIACTIFVVQDGVLTALRRTALVPLENSVFVAAKLGLVVVLAAAMPWHGIFTSWALAQGCVALAVGIFLFGWAIPRHQRNAADAADMLPPVGQVVRFVAFDYIGAICSVASVALMPILVIAVLGAEKNAYFSMAWVIAFSVHQINFNMGTSLVVDSAEDQSRLAHQTRHILAHTSKLLVIVVLAILLSAPYVLGLFGHSYREADNTLRLLALGALPHLIVVTAISSARVQRRMGLVVWTQITQCVLALGLMWLLLPIMGMTGAGLAWLVTQLAIACGLLIRRDLWLSLGHAPDARQSDIRAVRQWWTMASLYLLRIGPARPPRPASPALPACPDPETSTSAKTIRTLTDVAGEFVAGGQGTPAAVVKVARTRVGCRDLLAHQDSPDATQISSGA
jgi:O-antigen/teichoic acid export membrane protein